MLPFATLLAVLLAHLAAPVAAPAQRASTAPIPAPSSNSSTPKQTTRTIVGEIVSIDLARGLIVVGRAIKAGREPATPRSGESVAVSVDGTTKIVRGQSPATAADLRTKDQAVVRYQLTPQGAKALSFKVADLVIRTPAPKVTPSPSSGGAGGP